MTEGSSGADGATSVVDWSSREIRTWEALFLGPSDDDGWWAVGAAQRDGAGKSRGPAHRVALAAAEAMAAALGDEAVAVPAPVRAKALALGPPSRLNLEWGFEHAAQTWKKEDDGGERGAALRALCATLCGVSRAVARDPGVKLTMPPRPLLQAVDVLPGAARKQAIAVGDLVGIHLAEGWVLGRAVPVTYWKSEGPWVVIWFYAGLRASPDDVAGLSFESLWLPPRLFQRQVLADGRLQVLDPAHRSTSDGAPEALWKDDPAGMAAFGTLHPQRYRDLGELVYVLRLVSGVGLRAALKARLQHEAVVGGGASIEGAEGVYPHWIVPRARHAVLRLADPDVQAEIAAEAESVLGEIGDKASLRWAWLESVGYRRPA